MPLRLPKIAAKKFKSEAAMKNTNQEDQKQRDPKSDKPQVLELSLAAVAAVASRVLLALCLEASACWNPLANPGLLLEVSSNSKTRNHPPRKHDVTQVLVKTVLPMSASWLVARVTVARRVKSLCLERLLCL